MRDPHAAASRHLRALPHLRLGGRDGVGGAHVQPLAVEAQAEQAAPVDGAVEQEVEGEAAVRGVGEERGLQDRDARVD